jgi:hypothetical protein
LFRPIRPPTVLPDRSPPPPFPPSGLMEPVFAVTNPAEESAFRAAAMLSAHSLSIDSQYASDSDVSADSAPDGSTLIGTMSTSASQLSIAEPTVYLTAAESFAGMSLAEAMPRHKLRLERERDAAIARNEPRRPPSRTFEAQPSLDSILRPHKSAMEKAKEEAIARNEPRRPPTRTFEAQPSLDSMLRPHKSAMEKAKEAAVARNEPRRPPVRRFEEQPPLESMLRKSYSLVEREQQAIAGGHADAVSPGLGGPRRSRLQMEKEAAARLADAALAKAAAEAAAAKATAAREAAEAAAAAAAGETAAAELLATRPEELLKVETFEGAALSSHLSLADDERSSAPVSDADDDLM